MRFLLRLCAAIALLSFAGAAYLTYTLSRPYAGFETETFVDLPKGMSTLRMGETLQNAGVIRHAWEFLLARLVERNRKLQAGEYRFAQPASVFDVYGRIARGDIYYLELVVPEGKNMFDIGAMAERLSLFRAEEFVNAARDPSLVRDLDPKAPTLEGYLFPSSYRLTRHTDPARLCQIMTERFRGVWRGLHAAGDPHRVVTLASLVEKEGKLPEERSMIAQVFSKRLEIGMKLDCDPTTIYAALVENRYRGAIHKSDLESESPYNTYRHAGLPPGPIANPGQASLEAVLHPSATNYLYFVKRADDSGGHTFSENIAAHEIATAKYRHLEKGGRAAAPGAKKPRRHRRS
jgi:peptidoglycan lytic transglycosylase G